MLQKCSRHRQAFEGPASRETGASLSLNKVYCYTFYGYGPCRAGHWQAKTFCSAGAGSDIDAGWEILRTSGIWRFNVRRGRNAQLCHRWSRGGPFLTKVGTPFWREMGQGANLLPPAASPCCALLISRLERPPLAALLLAISMPIYW